MTLVLVESMKLRFNEETKPEFYDPNAAVEGGGKNGRPEKPKWGVIHRAPLPNDSDGREQNARAFFESNVLGQGHPRQPPDKPGSPWGVQNKPLVW
jgi:hypothetical protein